jgi:hypothetical protein
MICPSTSSSSSAKHYLISDTLQIIVPSQSVKGRKAVMHVIYSAKRGRSQRTLLTIGQRSTYIMNDGDELLLIYGYNIEIAMCWFGEVEQ